MTDYRTFWAVLGFACLAFLAAAYGFAALRIAIFLFTELPTWMS